MVSRSLVPVRKPCLLGTAALQTTIEMAADLSAGASTPQSHKSVHSATEPQKWDNDLRRLQEEAAAPFSPLIIAFLVGRRAHCDTKEWP